MISERRREKVKRTLEALSGSSGHGITAEEVAAAAGIDRCNASRELNRLVEAGLAEKLKGKPVRFQANGASAPTPVCSQFEATGPKETGPKETGAKATGPEAGLDSLPGASGSLRTAVQQAKAAILYPPHGLHTLILGSTGVGKTLFAEQMYKFGRESGRFGRATPFVAFNCADYASNPQLLLSNLFGHTRGAFTGAESDRPGLVEKADGGMLFLDEVHRLTSEGQEMFFHLIDRGVFRRLGETLDRRARVLLVCATTENPDSSLLRTFVRRMAMVITLPPLVERPWTERLEIVRLFFQAEADRIGIPLTVAGNALRRLLSYPCPGNVGQLRGDIQLACARAFLEYMGRGTGNIYIPTRLVPANTEPATVAEFEAAVFRPGTVPGPQPWPEATVYDLIEARLRDLQSEGKADQAGPIIGAEIERYFRRLWTKLRSPSPGWQQDVARLVGPEVLEWVNQAMTLAAEQLGLDIPQRVRFGLALHLSAALERLRQGHQIIHPRLAEVEHDYPAEFAVALQILVRLQSLSGIVLPLDEAGFIATFLAAAGSRPPAAQVGILVVAHGPSIAGALAAQANRLVEVEIARALDWPADEGLDRLVARVEQSVRDLDQGSGVLLLVDMGVLATIGEVVTERTGIPTRTVDMVTTARVVEAVRKAALPDITLDELARAARDAGSLPAPDARQYLSPAEIDGAAGRPIVVTVCLTGEGSARKLQQVLTEQVPALSSGEVELVSAAALDGIGRESARELVQQLLTTRPVIALVGTFDPGVEAIPFISVEEVVLGDGIAHLRRLMENVLRLPQPLAGMSGTAASLPPPITPSLPPEEDLFAILVATLGHQLRYINPALAARCAWRALDDLERDLEFTLGRDLRIGMAMHLVCMVEKLVRLPPVEASSVGRGSPGEAGNTAKLQDGATEGSLEQAVARALGPLAIEFQITVPPEHVLGLARMIDQQ